MTRVMIVDDEALMRKGLLTLIDWKALDCEVVCTEENGARAVESYKQYKPQIVISDIRMPVMDGLELARWFFENNSGVQVILLTAFADFEYAQKAIAYKVSNYVTKTGALDEIVAAVNKCKAQIEKSEQASAVSSDSAIMLLRSLIDGSVFSGESIAERARRCALSLGDFYLLTADIAGGSEQSDAELAKLRKIAEKLLTAQNGSERRYVVPVSRDRVTVVIGESAKCSPLSLCSDAAGMFTGLTGSTLLIGISTAHRTLGEVRAAFDESLEALSQSFFDRKSVHCYRNSPAPKFEHNSELIEAIGEAIRKGSRDGCAKLSQELGAAQKKAQMPEREIKAEAQILYGACRRALSRAGTDIADIGITEGRWRESVLSCKYFEDCSELQRSLADECCSVVENLLKRGSNIILDAQNYIDEHFCEPITLKDVALAVNVNPSYLSRCFKQKNGENLIDAITRRRIEYAKELISGRSMRMYEIAMEVGFNDTTYFSHVFKKYTGMSATAYQELYASDSRDKDDAPDV